MFTTFKEMEAYVLGQNLKKRIALANACLLYTSDAADE